MAKISAKGKIHVTTEPGEALSVEPTVGHLVLSNGTRVPVKRGFGNVAAAQTDSVLIAAVALPSGAARVIRVLSLAMVTGGTATEVTFGSKPDGGATTAIGPVLANAANGGAVLPFTPYGWMQTLALGDALVVTTGAGASTGFVWHYIELTDDLFDLL